MRLSFVLTLLGFFVHTGHLAAADLPTPKQIFDAWGVAADGFQSVKIVWTEKVHVTAYEGTKTKNMNEAIKIRMERAKRPVPVAGPLKEHTHENRYTLWLTKGKWRVKWLDRIFYPSSERPSGSNSSMRLTAP